MSTDMIIEVLGDKAVARRLGRVKRNLENWTPVWDEVADLLSLVAGRQFASEGMYGSGGWPELAPSTVADKQRGGFPPNILQRTGRLKDSLTVDDHPDHIRIGDAEQLWWGTVVPYARYHQHGTDLMPRRRPVEFPKSDRKRAALILQRYALANSPTAGVTG